MITKVAVDMDDVVVDFVGGLCQAVRQETNHQIYPEDIKQWELRPILDPLLGENFWNWLQREEWLWANFPAVPGAIGGIRKLRRDGYYVELLTSKPEWAEHNVWKWLGKWRPAIHSATIVGMNHSKVNFSDAELLIDDKMVNCLEWAEAGRQALLFTRPHNENLEALNRNIRRANDWNHAINLIEGITDE